MDNDIWRASSGLNRHTNQSNKDTEANSKTVPLEEKFPFQLEEDNHTTEEQNVWDRYNSQPFSPYTGNDKTLSVITVKGGVFCRKGETKQSRIYIPAFIQIAKGSNSEYNKVEQDGRVILSKHDLNEWDYTAGDVVLIVGRNNAGDTHKLNIVDSSTVTTILRNEEGKYNCPRQTALDYLNDEGYDVGSLSEEAIQQQEERDRDKEIESQLSDPRTPSSFPLTKTLQEEVEESNISDYSEKDRKHIAIRLLFQKGWEKAQEWFVEQLNKTKSGNSQPSVKAARYYLRSASDWDDSLPNEPERDEEQQPTKSPW